MTMKYEYLTIPPAGEPIMLSRNGAEFAVNGETNVRAGSEFKVSTARPSLNLTVKELDAGAWVMFELPGFTTAAAGTEQRSLDALRSASAVLAQTTVRRPGQARRWRCNLAVAAASLSNRRSVVMPSR